MNFRAQVCGSHRLIGSLRFLDMIVSQHYRQAAFFQLLSCRYNLLTSAGFHRQLQSNFAARPSRLLTGFSDPLVYLFNPGCDIHNSHSSGRGKYRKFCG